MDIRDVLRSPLVRSNEGVWVLERSGTFDYSDGAVHEQHLLATCRTTQDRSSTSRELEEKIVDWPSEYHLSRKRAHLVRDLGFAPDSTAIEVGCGCGAITRALGERYRMVVGVEGSLARARVARARTEDLANTEIVAAPLQDLDFAMQFDLVFCIGVLEYAAQFMGVAESPYDAMMERLSSLVAPEGHLILAIENQYGLKYWNNLTEDHTGRPFEGIEDYPAYGHRVRTFGRAELARRLSCHFEDLAFLYPYPDYKLPDAVLSEQLLLTPGVASLIAHTRQRDYRGPRRALFNRRQALGGLERNQALHLFSDSFLVVAKKSGRLPSQVAEVGVLYSIGRRDGFECRTRFFHRDGVLRVEKQPLLSGAPVNAWLRPRQIEEAWVCGSSLLMVAEQAALRRVRGRDEFLGVVRKWVDFVRRTAADGRTQQFDLTFDNVLIEPSGKLIAIDREWETDRAWGISSVLIRGLVRFYRSILEEPTGRLAVPGDCIALSVIQVLRACGVRLRLADFIEFVRLEVDIGHVVYGRSSSRTLVPLVLFLLSRRVHSGCMRAFAFCTRVLSRLRKVGSYLIYSKSGGAAGPPENWTGEALVNRVGPRRR